MGLERLEWLKIGKAARGFDKKTRIPRWVAARES